MVVEKCCASEFWRENNYSADNTTAIAVIFKTRPDPIDTPTKEAIQEKAEMDAAVAAAEKAMEGIGMPDDDEEEDTGEDNDTSDFVLEPFNDFLMSF